METEPFVPVTIEIESLEELSVLFHAVGESSGHDLFCVSERIDKKPIMDALEFGDVCYRVFKGIEVHYRRYVEKK